MIVLVPATPGLFWHTIKRLLFVTAGISLLAHAAASHAVAQGVREPISLAETSEKEGTTRVAMDSWMYPALERLAALGLIPSQELGIRPWTRSECLRQVREAETLLLERQQDDTLADQAERLLPDLKRELTEVPDSNTAALDSEYIRYGVIAGPAVTDSFHFGQTWWNDYGRPLARGSTALVGFSARATRGRYFFQVREEGQRDPGVAAVSVARAAQLSMLDFVPSGVTPYQPAAAQPAFLRGRPLSLSAGAVFAGNALSFGKQELYWGPGVMGPLSFSRNAEPTYNLRFGSIHPHPFPLIPQLGTYSFDLVFGKLSGHRYPARPYFNGAKVNLNFGQTLEVGFTRWSVLWGVNHPITFASLGRNLFSFNSTGTGAYGERIDPGDRKSDFDFRLRLPKIGKYVTLYADAYSDDDPNPIDAPRRAAWNPGIYFPRLPLLPHNDLRLEVVSTQGFSRDEGGGRFFTNNNYLDSNTNKGFLLGTAVGRDARALEARTGYWLSARTRLELGFRQTKGGTLFLPGGSTLSDAFFTGSFALRRNWMIDTFLQHERFLLPSITIPGQISGPQHNTSARLQVTWTPTNLFLRTRAQ